MTDAALYLTTAATLESSHISRHLSWLMAAIALIAHLLHPYPHWFWPCIVMLLAISAYYHLRIRIDIALLQHLATQHLSAPEMSDALLTLSLRQQALSHTPQSRCLACLRWWRHALCVDSVLWLVSTVFLLWAV